MLPVPVGRILPTGRDCGRMRVYEASPAARRNWSSGGRDRGLGYGCTFQWRCILHLLANSRV